MLQLTAVFPTRPFRRRTVVGNSTPDAGTVAGCVALPKMDETDDPREELRRDAEVQQEARPEVRLHRRLALLGPHGRSRTALRSTSRGRGTSAAHCGSLGKLHDVEGRAESSSRFTEHALCSQYPHF